MKVEVVLERAGENWCAYAPDLEDVVMATGDTREETIHRFQDALHGLFDYKRGQGKDVPTVTALEIRETLAWEEKAAAMIERAATGPAPQRATSSEKASSEKTP